MWKKTTDIHHVLLYMYLCPMMLQQIQQWSLRLVDALCLTTWTISRKLENACSSPGLEMPSHSTENRVYHDAVAKVPSPREPNQTNRRNTSRRLTLYSIHYRPVNSEVTERKLIKFMRDVGESLSLLMHPLALWYSNSFRNATAINVCGVSQFRLFGLKTRPMLVSKLRSDLWYAPIGLPFLKMWWSVW